MPKYPICNESNERNWIKLDELTPAQRRVLQEANTLDSDDDAQLDVQCQSLQLSHKQVLNEHEIRAWMAKNKANSKHKGFQILQERVPSLYTRVQWENKLQAINQDDFKKAKNVALNLLTSLLSQDNGKKTVTRHL